MWVVTPFYIFGFCLSVAKLSYLKTVFVACYKPFVVAKSHRLQHKEANLNIEDTVPNIDATTSQAIFAFYDFRLYYFAVLMSTSHKFKDWSLKGSSCLFIKSSGKWLVSFCIYFKSPFCCCKTSQK
jgi:hypothetical protein